MSDEQTTSPEPEPSTPAASPASSGGASPCETYIASELAKTRQSLKTTQIGAVVLTLIVGGGLFYITSGFLKSLEPHAAAEIATGLITAQVNEKGPDLANQLKEKIPEMIAQAPAYVKTELPNYRTSVEDRVEEELTKYAKSTSDELGKKLDEFLEENKDAVKEMMASANNAEAIQKAGPKFKEAMLAYVQEKPEQGESIQSQIDETLKSLQEISAKVNKLAANKGLTPQEAKTRKAIAILAQAIEEQRVKLTQN
jgi:hypothetical protein